jgi:hypothetical protein
VTDTGPVHEVGQGVSLQQAPHFVGDVDPDLLEDAMALAVVMLVDRGREGTINGGQDLGQGDLGRWAGEHVPPADPPL